MKTIFIFLLTVATLNAQNIVLEFDGNHSYVDLGVTAGNNVRTIEFWFKLDNAINGSINETMTFVSREISDVLGNQNEFVVMIQGGSNQYSGHIRFDLDGTAPYKSVYSNSNNWNANQWYHVAAVIHPVTGMSLFIDGKKQLSTHPHNAATATVVNEHTLLGEWGKGYFRNFKGKMDDVRFSSTAIYTIDFTPPCPDIMPDSNSNGVWNFNEPTGVVVLDASQNQNHGSLSGPTRIADYICISHEINRVLQFDGVDDNVDLGTSAGNGIRTIELWFKLDQTIDGQLTETMTFVSREISDLLGNQNEFTLMIQGGSNQYSGHIRFDIDATFPFKSVYSNSKNWMSNRWYHVAAVVDPVTGMSLFIDGIKQTSTHPHNSPTATVANEHTLLGEWGKGYLRSFRGQMDDVHFSSMALYSSNFIPPCPSISAVNSSIAVWNFNEPNGSTAVDVSTNQYNGILDGAVRIIEDLCIVSSIDDLDQKENNAVRVFPNPCNGILQISLEDNSQFDLNLYNELGQIVLSLKNVNAEERIDISNLPEGIYFGEILLKKERKIAKIVKF